MVEVRTILAVFEGDDKTRTCPEAGWAVPVLEFENAAMAVVVEGFPILSTIDCDPVVDDVQPGESFLVLLVSFLLPNDFLLPFLEYRFLNDAKSE